MAAETDDPTLTVPVVSVSVFVLAGASSLNPAVKFRELAIWLPPRAIVPTVPFPKVRSSPGAVVGGAASTTPLVVQLLALVQLTPSPATPMGALPSQVADCAAWRERG